LAVKERTGLCEFDREFLKPLGFKMEG